MTDKTTNPDVEETRKAEKEAKQQAALMFENAEAGYAFMCDLIRNVHHALDEDHAPSAAMLLEFGLKVANEVEMPKDEIQRFCALQNLITLVRALKATEGK